jgi:ATP-dependent Clp protease protease subunit
MSEKQEERPKRASTLEDEIDWTLLKARRLYFSGTVDDDTAREAIRRLWYMELTEPGKPILIVINSPGGSVDSLCAAPGRRLATPNARIMIHQPLIGGVIQGQATDLDVQAREIIKTRKKLVELYAEHTGKDAATIDRALDRDNWMSAQEAKDFGLLDGVVDNFAALSM